MRIISSIKNTLGQAMSYKLQELVNVIILLLGYGNTNVDGSK